MAGKPPNGHKYSPWRRSILVPFWILQTLLMLIIVGLLATALGVLNYHLDDSDYNKFGSSREEVKDAIETAMKVVVPVWIAFSALCIIVTFLEIIFLVRRKLTPAKFLVLNVIKSGIWTVLFVLDIIAWAGSDSSRRVTALGIIMELGLVLCFWIPLLYGSIIFHRYRKNKGAYNKLSNPALQNPRIDLESVPPCQSQTTGVTGNAYGHDPRYENYKQGAYGYPSPNPNLASPPIPQVFVQHHDVHEMDNARRTLN